MLELKRNGDLIIFKPVSGYTLDRAIAESIDLSKKENTSLLLYMNEIVLPITKNSKLSQIRKKYLDSLEKRENGTVVFEHIARWNVDDAIRYLISLSSKYMIKYTVNGIDFNINNETSLSQIKAEYLNKIKERCAKTK